MHEQRWATTQVLGQRRPVLRPQGPAVDCRRAARRQQSLDARFEDRRPREEWLARLRGDRLASIAEMAVAFTHEVTQPLTAAANFVSAARRLVGDAPDAVAALDKAEAQMVRAGRNHRSHARIHRAQRTRDGRAKPPRNHPGRERTCRARPQARRRQSDLPPGGGRGPRALVDRVEIEQALVNLLRNAIDAVGGSPSEQSRSRPRSQTGPFRLTSSTRLRNSPNRPCPIRSSRSTRPASAASAATAFRSRVRLSMPMAAGSWPRPIGAAAQRSVLRCRL